MKPNRRINHQPEYRFLASQLHLDDDTRRQMNESLTGHPSSAEFSASDWKLVLGWLRDHLPGAASRAAAAAPNPGALPTALDVGATRKQIALIEQLAVERMRHPDRLPELIRRHAFSKRQAAMAAQWSGSLATLPRDAASRAAKILLRLPHLPAAQPSV
jgi:hypothetical protein